MDQLASSSSLLSPPASASPTPSPPTPKRRRSEFQNSDCNNDDDVDDDRVAGFRCSAGFVSVKGRPLDGRAELRQNESGYGEELAAETAPGKDTWKVGWFELKLSSEINVLLSPPTFQYLSWSSPITLFGNSRSFTLDSLFDEFSRDLLLSFFGHRINALIVAAADPEARL